MIGIFLGLIVGGSGNIGLPSIEMGEETGVVSLDSTEYPFGDLEAEIGSGEKTYGNTTFQVDGEPYIGTPEADVTAVSYEDFQCPFCRQYNQNAFPQIVENYVRNGEAQYFYKHLPLPADRRPYHVWARPSALASECALNQDAEVFWTFKNGFFNNQDALSSAYKDGQFNQSMYRWAEQTGLNQEQFRQCYDNQEEMDEVRQDSREAALNGAQATPTIIINDRIVQGAQPYSRFESTIESALQQ